MSSQFLNATKFDINYVNMPFDEQLDRAVSAILSNNSPPKIFNEYGIATVVKQNYLKPISVASMQVIAARCVNFRKVANGVHCNPPKDLVAALACSSELIDNLPKINRIVRIPSFDTNGEIICVPGYREKTEEMYLPTDDTVLYKLPPTISPDLIKKSKNLILNHLLVDFPFHEEIDRTHAVGALLQYFVMPMIDGPTPMYVISSSDPGFGKTLLASCIHEVAVGTSPDLLTISNSPLEAEYSISAVLWKDSPDLIFDNITRLDPAVLARYVTATSVAARVIGSSDVRNVCTCRVWIATGNNIDIPLEMWRRTVRIRLQADDQPYLWNDQNRIFKHPEIIKHIKTNRPKYIGACHILIRSWLDAGSPVMNEAKLGGFQSWTKIIGSILGFHGFSGFLGHFTEPMPISPEDEAFSDLIDNIWLAFQGKEFTAGNVVKDCEEKEIINHCGRNSKSLPISLGIYLKKKVGCSARGFRLELRVDKHKGQNKYFLVPLKKIDCD